MSKRLTMLLTLFTFVFAFQSNPPLSSSSKTTSKDQIACTVCDSCENPCQPLPSPPPPPPVVICPPPPPPLSPPPPPAVPKCPPPPAPPSCSACIPSPEVPQLSPPTMPFTPPFPPSTGEFAPPDRVPYFPNDYNPPPSSATSICLELD
ncbi:hypothetical protein OWV82_000800 [Melia azedarach]|uniref:Uncharacterized protein n=1 Tax=Melia azedarach TaxID=155640 RepID=A0ACC1YXI8_MELAZ|nr:hypothetical protein OWV82_000800 [Melia azedarach]